MPSMEIPALRVESIYFEWDAELDPDPTDRSMEAPGIEWQAKTEGGERYNGYVDWHESSGGNSGWIVEGFFEGEARPMFSFNVDGRRKQDLEQYLVYVIVRAIQEHAFKISDARHVRPEGDWVLTEGYRTILTERLKKANTGRFRG